MIIVMKIIMKNIIMKSISLLNWVIIIMNLYDDLVFVFYDFFYYIIFSDAIFMVMTIFGFIIYYLNQNLKPFSLISYNYYYYY